jgi:hypothetical protein
MYFFGQLLKKSHPMYDEIQSLGAVFLWITKSMALVLGVNRLLEMTKDIGGFLSYYRKQSVFSIY